MSGGIGVEEIVEAIGNFHLGRIDAGAEELAAAILAIPGKTQFRAGSCRAFEGPDYLTCLED